MAATILNIAEIISDPDIRGGQPVIVGTGIRVSDIVARHISGDDLTAEQLTHHFDLSMGQVYAALAYYHLHEQEINDELRSNEQNAEKLAAELEKQGRLIRLD